MSPITLCASSTLADHSKIQDLTGKFQHILTMPHRSFLNNKEKLLMRNRHYTKLLICCPKYILNALESVCASFQNKMLFCVVWHD